jgi:hypothetical protein
MFKIMQTGLVMIGIEAVTFLKDKVRDKETRCRDNDL